MIISINKPYMWIGKRSEVLTIKDGAKIREVPVRHVESVVLLTKGQIHHDALIMLAEHGIPVYYMRHGKPYAAYLPFAHHGFVKTRKAQFDAYSNKKGIQFMQAVIAGALENKSRMLKYYARNRRSYDQKAASFLMKQARRIEKLKKKVQKMPLSPVAQRQTRNTQKTRTRKTQKTRTRHTRHIKHTQANKSNPNNNKNNNKKKNNNNNKNNYTNENNYNNKNNYNNENNYNNKNKQPAQKNKNNQTNKNEQTNQHIQPNKSKNTTNKNQTTHHPTNYSPSSTKFDTFIKTFRQKLMGFEGTGSRMYYKALQEIFPTNLHFSGRNRRPPRDPVNAAISFGNHLLANEVMTAIVAAGLEPYAGFLHSDRSGRPSLVFDLIEEFRQPIVDRLIIRLFQRQLLVVGDFDFKIGAVPKTPNYNEGGETQQPGTNDNNQANQNKNNNNEKKGKRKPGKGDHKNFTHGSQDETGQTVSVLSNTRGVRFKEEALQEFLTNFYYYIRKDGLEIKGWFRTYQQIMLRQARKLVRFFSGKDSTYKPFKFKW